MAEIQHLYDALENQGETPCLPTHGLKYWRERMGVEPTTDTEGCPSTDLKSAKLTGAYSLPNLHTYAELGAFPRRAIQANRIPSA